MAVSVRMESTLEQELERAARKLGVSKSQFIIDAVERALGRRDPQALLERAHRRWGLAAPTPATLVARDPGSESASAPTGSAVFRSRLQARHDAEMRDWLAYQAAKRSGQAWQPDDDATAAQ